MSVNEPTRRLLAEAFPDDPKFSRDAFLDWEYDSPSGQVIERNRDDEVGRLGHYAVLPQRWQRDGVVEPWALSLNTAVSERARGELAGGSPEISCRGRPASLTEGSQACVCVCVCFFFQRLRPVWLPCLALTPGQPCLSH
jgi:hypothetical protein